MSDSGGGKFKLKVDPEPTGNDSLPVRETIDDYTGPSAHGRTLFVNLSWLKFGINDKTLSIAVVLAALLLVMVLIFGITSIWSTNSVIGSIIDGLLKALFMAIGVIVGRHGKNENP